MLASIHPLGERARSNRWGVTAGAYSLASTLGGAGLGAALGAIGWTLFRPWSPPDPLRVGVIVAAAAAACAWDLMSGRSLPPFRQVDEDWLARYRGWVYGAGFGFQLGMGVTTIITTALVPVVFLTALVAGSPAWGAAIGAAFGIARAVPLLATRRVASAHALRAFHLRLQAINAPARVIAVGVVAGSVAMTLAGAR